MGIAQVQVQDLALHRGAETHTVNFKLDLIAFTDAFDHVIDQAAAQPVQGFDFAIITGAGERHGVIFHGGGNFTRETPGKFAFGAFHINLTVILDLNGDFVRDWDVPTADTGHGVYLRKMLG
jgi:hypothetical protein